MRCPRHAFRLVWAALTCTTALPYPARSQVVVRVVRVSGTIKKAEQEIVRRAKKIVARAKGSEGDGDVVMQVLGLGNDGGAGQARVNGLDCEDEDDEDEDLSD